VNLLAADERKISDVVVDLVGDVGGVHDAGRLVALGRGVVVLIGDDYGVWSPYMFICLPGSNDKCLVK
jgi:hypothetical protein